MVSQEEAHELVGNLQLALKEIEKIAALHDAKPAVEAEVPREAATVVPKRATAKAPRKSKAAPAPAAKVRRAASGARAAR